MSKIGIIFKTGGHIAPEDYGISQIIILDEADLPEYESIMEKIMEELPEYDKFDKWERLENKLKETGIQYELLRNLQEEYRFQQV